MANQIPTPPQPPFAQKPQAEQQKPQTQKQQQLDIIPLLSEEIKSLATRVKQLEYELQLLKKKLDVFNQNLLTTFKKEREMIDILKNEIQILKKNLSNDEEIIGKMISELKNSAKKEEIMRLERYIDFWKPIDFVTYKTVEKIFEQKIKEFFEDFEGSAKLEEIITRKLKKMRIEK
ncbi:MAG: hypothetical protein QXD62_01080 [Candidatus Woesearchaeota archaeon]